MARRRLLRYNRGMFIVGLLGWWYTEGWKQRLSSLRERIAKTYDYFSIDLLVRSLFAPFRQISASRVDGPIALKWRAFLDRLISRIIGTVLRLFLIVIGTIAVIFFSMIGIIGVVVWAIIPLIPFIGGVMAIIGWTPVWI